MRILLLKRTFFVIVFACFLHCSKSFGQTFTPKFVSIVGNSGGFWEYLPVNYSAPNNTQTYPMIVFGQGLGELGDGGPGELSKLLLVGLPALIGRGAFPATFTVNGQTFSFIVISPQFRQAPSVSDMQSVINYAVQHYRVNVDRIYMTGLSNGGGMSWEYPSAKPSYASRLAAVVPICGSFWPSPDRARVIANANLAVWGTHCDLDPIWSVQSTIGWIDQINTVPLPTPLAKKTIFQNNSSHDAWTVTYDPGFREDGKNIYEWMLQYHRNYSGTNQLPAADAGGNINLGLPANSTLLNAGNSWDPDGSIAAYNWTWRSGPTQFTFNNSHISTPVLSNLVEGRYVFQLAVTDNQGAIGIDSTVINVAPVIKPVPGKIEAENYTTMFGVQTESCVDTGGASDVGFIDNADWMDYSVNVASTGPYIVKFRVATSATGAQVQLRKADGTILTTANIPQTGGYQVWTTVSVNAYLQAGNQTLRVYASSVANWNFNWIDFFAIDQSPSANAGPSQTVISPAVSQAVLTGSGTAFNGATVASYGWSQLSGTAAVITTPSEASTTITGLTTLGIRVFRLTITDNLGRTGTSDVTVTVNPPGPPVASAAGSPSIIQLPYSQVTLIGSGTANNGGSITTYAWSQVSGTAATITNPLDVSTTVTALTTSGARVFRLTVTDNDGLTATSDVTITVLPVNLSTPYGGTRKTIPGKLEAEEFDNGGQNIAYMDGTGGNLGGAFRLSDAVDVRNCPDIGGGYCVGWTTDGEWLKYSVNVTTTGAYIFTARITTPNAGKSIQLQVDGLNLGTLTVINTGGYNNWQTVTLNNVLLTAGNHTFRFLFNTGDATNPDFGFDVNWFNFELVPNQAPIVNAGTPQTIQLPISQVQLTGTGSTPNVGGTITYAWTRLSGPNAAPALSIVTPTAASTLITGMIQGIYVFRLTVTDNLSVAVTSDVTITVNQPPTANAGPNQTIIAPASQVTLAGTGVANNGGTITYAWTRLSGPNTAPALSIVTATAAGTNVTGLILGTYVFRLTVTDNRGGVATSDVTITVNPGPPGANAGSPQHIILPASQVTLTGTGTANNGGTITYAWTELSGPNAAPALSIVTPTTAGTLVTGLTEGTYVFRLTVTDNEGTATTSDVTITVTQPPTANAGPNQIIILPVSQVTLTGTGVANNGGTITYAWTRVSGPNAAPALSIATPTAAGTLVTGLIEGAYVFRLTITDNYGGTATSDVTIKVQQPPTANAGPNQKIILPVSEVTLAGTGVANNGGTITYAWTKISGPNSAPALSIVTATAAGTLVTGLIEGVYVFRLTVTDNDGGVTTSNVTISVVPPGPPTANAGTAQTIILPLSQVTLTGTGVANNGGTITYGWTEVSGPNAAPALSIVTPAAASTNVTGLIQGVYVFRLTVTDNDLRTTTSDVTITVHQPPTVNAGAPQTIQLPISQVTLTGTGTANNGGTITYAWTRVSGPNAAPALSIVTPTVAGTNVTGLIQGVYVFRLTVTDNDGTTATSDVAITVNQPPTANAGTAQTTQLPISQVTLTGTGVANNGGTITYGWTRVSGPNAAPALSIVTPTTASTLVTGLIQGSYVFRLTVTDNLGGIATSDVSVTVLPVNLSTPYGGTRRTIPGKLEAEEYDNGGQNIAYLDGTTANLGGALRLSESVDTRTCPDVGGGYCVGWTTDGEWLKFSVNVTTTGIYIFTARTASPNTGKTIQFQVDGSTAGTLTVLNTGGYNNWQTATLNNVQLAAGDHTFRFMVNTGDASNPDLGFDINWFNFALAPNQSPTANAGSPQTITLPTSQVTLAGSGAANNGGTITYGWTEVSGPNTAPAVSIVTPTAASTNVTGLIQGTYIFRLTVTRNDNQTATSDVTVTVNPVPPPTANAGPNQTIQLPISQVTLAGSGVANNGGTITYAWTRVSGPNTAPALSIVTPAAASTDVTGLVQGAYVFRLTVTQNDNQATTSDVTITVNPVPPPTANAGTAQTIQLPTSQVTLTGTGTANNGGTITYGWALVSGPNAAPALSIVTPTAASTNVTGLIQGTYIFRLTVTRNDNQAATSDVTITVNPVNASTPYGGTRRTIPGKLEAEEYDNGGLNIAYLDGTTANLGGALRLSESVDVRTCPDVGGGYCVGWTTDGEWLKYSVNVTTTGIYIFTARTASPNTGKTIQFQVDGAAAGTLTVLNTGGYNNWQTATLNNVQLAAGDHTFRFMVNTGDASNPDLGFDINWFNFALAPNQSPTANAGSPQTITLPTSQVTLAGSGAANNGGTITYGWTEVSGPNTAPAVSIATPTAASTNVTGLIQGTYIFRLTVTRNDNQTATSDVTITVNPVPPPTANAGSNQTILLPTSQATLTGTGVANNGGTITYAWTRVSGPNTAPALSIVTPAAASTNVTGLIQGVYVFRLTVTQNDNQAATSDVTITVSPVQPPTANAGTAQAITLPISQVTLTGSGTVGNGGTITYGWTQVSGTAATITTPSSASTTVTGLSSSGVRVFRLTVTQSDNQTATSDVTITVNPASNGKTIPGKIETESWDAKSGGMYAIPTTDAGGGMKVVGISNGSSMDYNVNVVSGGIYTVNFRIATTQVHTQFQVKLGNTILGTINIPSSGDWNTWITVPLNNVSLAAGAQTLRILSTNNENCDFNWMDFVLTAGGNNQPVVENMNVNQTIVANTSSAGIAPPGQAAANAGTTAPSNVFTERAVKAEKTLSGSLFKIFPNPVVTDQFALEINNDHAGIMTVQIIDQGGNIKKEAQYIKNKGLTRVYLSTTGIAKGLYIVRVQTGDQSNAIKMIKL